MTDDLRLRLQRVDPAPIDVEPPTGSMDAMAVLREIESRTSMNPREITTEELETRVTTKRPDETDAATPLSDDRVRQPRRRAPVIAAAAFAVVLLAGAVIFGISVLLPGDDAPVTGTTLGDPAPVPVEPLEVAIAYWEATEAADVDAVLATVDPNVRDRDVVTLTGRGDSIVSNFDWYDVVGWTWTLESCDQVSDIVVTCSGTARNAWSDVLGKEPVTGAFTMRVIDGVIISVEEDENQSFGGQWGPQVFWRFAQWVEANHPDEAAIMFSENPLNDEILELYRVNTERFVAAQTAEE